MAYCNALYRRSSFGRASSTKRSRTPCARREMHGTFSLKPSGTSCSLASPCRLLAVPSTTLISGVAAGPHSFLVSCTFLPLNHFHASLFRCSQCSQPRPGSVRHSNKARHECYDNPYQAPCGVSLLKSYICEHRVSRGHAIV